MDEKRIQLCGCLSLVGVGCWIAGAILALIPHISWWYTVGFIGAGFLFAHGGVVLGRPIALPLLQSFPAWLTRYRQGGKLKPPGMEMTPVPLQSWPGQSWDFASSADPTPFSDALGKLVKEVEQRSGRMVQVFDNKDGGIPQSAMMPGLGPPPFYSSPDFRDGIRVYAQTGMLPTGDIEAAVAHVLIKCDMSFEGFPLARLSSKYVRASTLGADSKNPCANDADAIQEWLHQALLSLVAEERAFNRGFTRQTNDYEHWIAGIENRPSFSVKNQRSAQVLLSIDLAILLLEAESRIIPPECGPLLAAVIRKTELGAPRAVAEARQVVETVQRYGRQDPNQFEACFKAVLRLWGLEEAVELGRLNPRTCEIETWASSR